MGISVFNRGAMRTALGCAGLALVLSVSGCGDTDRAKTAAGTSTDLGVLSAQQTADVFLFNEGDDELSVTLANANVTSSKYAKRVVPNKAGRNTMNLNSCDEMDRCFTMRLKNLHQEQLAQAVANKGNGEITRNTVYTDLAKGETTDMWITYDVDKEPVYGKFPFQKLCDNDALDNIIVMAQVVDGKPVYTEEQAKELDDFFGKRNPYDPDGLSVRQRVNDTFGTEWRQDGGKDGTEKIIVAIVSEKNFTCWGYCDIIDCSDLEYSNRGEILYMNAKDQSANPESYHEDILCTFAHEYQHMCHFNQRYIHEGKFDGTDEGCLVDEGCSVLTEQMIGLGLDCQKEGEGIPGLYSHAKYWLDFMKQSWVYQFGDYWDEEAEALGGTIYGCYGAGGCMMRYIADNLGFETVERIAQGRDANDQPMNDIGVDCVEKATNKDFADIGLAMMVASADYQNAPQGLYFTNLDFRTYSIKGKFEDEYEVRDVAIEPLAPMEEVSVGDLVNEQVKLPAHAGGFVRLVGDGKTALVLQNSALNADAKGTLVVSKAQQFEKQITLK